MLSGRSACQYMTGRKGSFFFFFFLKKIFGQLCDVQGRGGNFGWVVFSCLCNRLQFIIGKECFQHSITWMVVLQTALRRFQFPLSLSLRSRRGEGGIMFQGLRARLVTKEIAAGCLSWTTMLFYGLARHELFLASLTSGGGSNAFKLIHLDKLAEFFISDSLERKVLAELCPL